MTLISDRSSTSIYAARHSGRLLLVTHVRGLNGDKEHDVVLAEGVPLLPHVHAVEVRQVQGHLGQHLSFVRSFVHCH